MSTELTKPRQISPFLFSFFLSYTQLNFIIPTLPTTTQKKPTDRCPAVVFTLNPPFITIRSLSSGLSNRQDVFQLVALVSPLVPHRFSPSSYAPQQPWSGALVRALSLPTKLVLVPACHRSRICIIWLPSSAWPPVKSYLIRSDFDTHLRSAARLIHFASFPSSTMPVSIQIHLVFPMFAIAMAADPSTRRSHHPFNGSRRSSPPGGASEAPKTQ